ncbi:MAG: hypothetical protein RR645_00160, partial [Clostridium sp.]
MLQLSTLTSALVLTFTFSVFPDMLMFLSPIFSTVRFVKLPSTFSAFTFELTIAFLIVSDPSDNLIEFGKAQINAGADI